MAAEDSGLLLRCVASFADASGNREFLYGSHLRTVIDDYARHPDFSISAVSDPRGLWSDGATSWISRDTSGSVKFHACHLEDDPGTDANEYGTRDSAKEFASPSTEANHRTADEGYCYSCEFCPGGVFGTGLAGVPAWNRAERTRATSRDFACRASRQERKVVETLSVQANKMPPEVGD